MSDLEIGRAYSGYSIFVDTPDGQMFVHIVENEKECPIKLFVNIGKAGSSLAALADSTARLVSELLDSGKTIYQVIELLSGIRGDRITTKPNGETVTSVPEGIAIALIKYRQIHFRKNAPKYREGGPSIE